MLPFGDNLPLRREQLCSEMHTKRKILLLGMKWKIPWIDPVKILWQTSLTWLTVTFNSIPLRKIICIRLILKGHGPSATLKCF